MTTQKSKPIVPTRPLIPFDLEARLRRQGERSPPSDPLLLAKLIMDDGGELYLIDMHEHHGMRWGTAVTCYEPAFEEGFPILFLSFLQGRARLCPEFHPVRLSEIAGRLAGFTGREER